MTNEIRELNAAELDAVGGGMKWTHGTKNDDVVDRRAETRAENAMIAGLAGAFGGGAGGAGPK